MPARIPLDVDMEDKLLYGLTPARLGYLVVALLAAFSMWSGHWANPAIRGTGTAMIAAIGAAAAWGRWRGRPADSWVIDLVLFLTANYYAVWNGPRPVWR